MSSRESVAFLGPVTSYTHQAALSAFPASEHNLVPQVTIGDVFEAVQNGDASTGVVPFENSTNGAVVFTLDLFADIAQRNPDILVSGEIYVDVHHCLVGHAPRGQHDAQKTSVLVGGSGPVKPRVDLKQITKLYSHPQAWGQCNNFLSTYLKGIERQDVSSTSRGAEIVATERSGSTAAISSELAAQAQGLDVLARNIEDSDDNKTRFFILRKESHESNDSTMSTTTEEEVAINNRHKTLVSFTVKESTNAGALADSLAVFKPYALNLTSINTRPSSVAPWNYIFFVEITGRRLAGTKGAVNAALRDLTEVARDWRWLGSWENQLVKPERGI